MQLLLDHNWISKFDLKFHKIIKFSRCIYEIEIKGNHRYKCDQPQNRGSNSKHSQPHRDMNETVFMSVIFYQVLHVFNHQHRYVITLSGEL